ncbi:MAG: hypothetical protein JWN86_4170 [Planctomycetota bacterium]|nr:hypothetical protein [Planctomycetota bacterium]
MEPHHLRTPKTDQAVLAVPPLEQAARLLSTNAKHLARWDYDFQGRRSSRLRDFARTQILERSREYLARFGVALPDTLDPQLPLVVTGHQPELFHPGVWIKNFAIAAIANEQGGTALNLIVDNDIPKSSTIRVPHAVGSRLQSAFVEFDAWSGEVPYEDWTVADESLFASFGRRVRETLGDLVPDPMIDDAWPEAIRAGAATDRIGYRFAAARHALEQSFGVNNAEIPLSVVCDTEAFGWFACHLLAQLPRFQSIHNASLARYRATYGIRSKNHPVPRLDREGEWLESPFWAWRAEAPRRRPLMARQGRTTLDLRIAGESEVLGSLRLTPDREACCAVEELQDLIRRGVRIRTRALTTTMFARLLLGDLFVHGIGGAKYDELGDDVIREFFGIEPPDYMTLSMTLWLDLKADPSAASQLKALDRARRDLTFNPDRLLARTDDDEIQSLVAAKRAAVAAPVGTRRDRIARFHQIRRQNALMARYVEDEFRKLVRDGTRLGEIESRNAVAMSREWAFVLHSRSRWQGTIETIFPSAVRT